MHHQGGNQGPGQTPAPITVTGSQAIPANEIKNGNTPFSVVAVAPPPMIAGAPEYPNTNWTEPDRGPRVHLAVITVEQNVS